MYKLVVVGGKYRGDEFILNDGENTLGRDDENDICLSIDGISKRHLKITIKRDSAYIEDLGSSNGTFLNGNLIKRSSLENGDQLALPDAVLQVVYVVERKKIIEKKVAAQTTQEDEVDEEDFLKVPDAPKSLVPKLIWLFKHKIMNVFYGINEEYEWRVLFGIVLAIFVFINISLTIMPILRDAKQILRSETALRGIHFAEEIARMNSKALESKNLDLIDTGFLENEKGVESYELFDMEGRIFRPSEKLNEYVQKGLSVAAKEYFKNQNDRRTLVRDLGGGMIGIAHKIEAYNMRRGRNEGVAIIAIKFKPQSLMKNAAKNRYAYMESLMTSGVVAIFFFGIIYYLTIRIFSELKFQIEQALRGKIKNVEGRYLFGELDPLKSTINSLIQRVRESSDEGGSDFEEMEEDTTYVETLEQFLSGAGVPAMILNSNKELMRLNSEAEDITSIRETSAQGDNIEDVAREKGFAGTIIELCDTSANNQGEFQSGEYELQGNSYSINVVALMGKDSFAKAYYLTFVQDD